MLNKGLEEGRSLLASSGPSANSLAAEFEAMSENEVSGGVGRKKCFKTNFGSN